jgi:tRNA threonylcarbamoyladenosine biosynthesis protein TsaB
MPRLLALDASTDTIHLALVVDARLWCRAVPGGAQSSAVLLPTIQSLLAEAGLTLRELDGLGFGRGPGAFTGLRTACAVAQGLALGAERPLFALDTLALVAESALRQGAPQRLWVAMDARMGEIYAALWQRQGDADADWQAQTEVGLYTPAQLVAAIHAQPAALAGNAVTAHAELAVQAGVAAWPLARPDGEALAALVARAYSHGTGLDPALALPLYVRDKVAQTTAERAATKRAKDLGALPEPRP